MNNKFSIFCLSATMMVFGSLSAFAQTNGLVEGKSSAFDKNCVEFFTGTKRVVSPLRFSVSGSSLKRVARRAKASVAVVKDLPWSVNFDSPDEFAQFTTIDVNHDAEATSYAYKKGVWNHFINSSTGNGAATYCYSANKADDWLITPGLKMTGGKTYYLRYRVKCVQSTFPERYEVKMGTAPTVEAMQTVVLSETEVDNTEYKEIMQEVKPTSTGTYYIGFHAISEGTRIWLYLDDMSVQAAPEAKSPAEATNFILTADPTAALKATISVTAPTKTFDKSDLTDLQGIRIEGPNGLVADLKTSAGKTVTCIDESLKKDGLYTYTATPYNAVGSGPSIKQTVYIGVDVPDVPENVVLHNDPNKVFLSWNPSKGVHKGVIKPEEVTYEIYKLDYSAQTGLPIPTAKVAEVMGETCFYLDFGADQGPRGNMFLGVSAKNKIGESDDVAISNTILLGTPLDAPYQQSFVDGKWGQYLLITTEGTGCSVMGAGVTAEQTDASDNDGGCAKFMTMKDDLLKVSSYKISLANTKKPHFVYRQKNNATDGTFTASVTTPDGKTTILETAQLAKEIQNQWVTKSFDLSKYINERYICVNFLMEDKKDGYAPLYVYIDNIHVGDVAPTDMGVTLSNEKKMERGTTTKLKVVANNRGKNKVDNYTISIKVGDKVVKEIKETQPIGSFETKAYEIDYQASLLETTENLPVVVEIKAQDDQVEENNKAVSEIQLTSPKLSRVQNLTIEKEQSSTAAYNIVLNWKTPSPLVPTTDDFESYNPWSISNLAPWTLHDGDNGNCGMGFIKDSHDQPMPYEHQGEPFAYIVFNPHQYNGYDLIEKGMNRFKAHSGKQYLASIFSFVDDETAPEKFRNIDNNDWLISPELPGKAQSVSFYVNSLTDEMKQEYEVLYSTTTNQVEAFKAIDGKRIVANANSWEEVNVNLPEGTKYFAIRHVSNAKQSFVFMLDDVTYYIEGGAPTAYRVYRDGVLLIETTDTHYTDQNVPTGDHIYQVTALYGDKESAAETVNTTATAIATITSTKAKQFNVYTLGGTLVRHAATTMNGLPKGVYLVNNRKVVVK